MDDMADRIRAYISEEVLLGDTMKSLENDTPLLDGILDSLALTQLVGFIEEEFDTEVDDADITSDNFRTVGDIERLVRARMTPA
ncbi:MAG TPA: acyl carrier protein [Actinomycetota bacterium]|jgi:acyl carrier protein|nr:acyl carrier protein [Actinomycetota bacterium]